jgi:glycine/D-amino acid oxidase-like deaminating enzyme
MIVVGAGLTGLSFARCLVEGEIEDIVVLEALAMGRCAAAGEA